MTDNVEASTTQAGNLSRDTHADTTGRIKIDADIIHGISAEHGGCGWFMPGGGNSEWFKDKAFTPEMLVVPAGSFVMGASQDEELRGDDEGPQHEVVIEQPFAVGRFALTVGEFTSFVEATRRAMPDKLWTFENDTGEEREGRSFRDPGFLQTEHHPVVGVSWEDAAAYCVWLTQTTSRSYRLLSEAEWEYCCRAGTTTPFWFGHDISTAQANFNGDCINETGKRGEFRRRTVPVDCFDPNPWGLYQVHGNVWEWCEDNWHPSYHGAPSDGSAWKGEGDQSRVRRGSSWNSDPRYLRSACRHWFLRQLRNNVISFRVARTL